MYKESTGGLTVSTFIVGIWIYDIFFLIMKIRSEVTIVISLGGREENEHDFALLMIPSHI